MQISPVGHVSVRGFLCLCVDFCVCVCIFVSVCVFLCLSVCWGDLEAKEMITSKVCFRFVYMPVSPECPITHIHNWEGEFEVNLQEKRDIYAPSVK